MRDRAVFDHVVRAAAVEVNAVQPILEVQIVQRDPGAQTASSLFDESETTAASVLGSTESPGTSLERNQSVWSVVSYQLRS